MIDVQPCKIAPEALTGATTVPHGAILRAHLISRRVLLHALVESVHVV